MSHFVDDETKKSFIRVEFEDDASDDASVRELAQTYKKYVATSFGMRFEFFPSNQKIPTLIAVSKQSHCLNALLHRWADGHLPIEITAGVSNHNDQAHW